MMLRLKGWQLIDDERGASYVVVEEIRDRALAEDACRAVLDVLRPRVARASVDAFTDVGKVASSGPSRRIPCERALHYSSAVSGVLPNGDDQNPAA
jgi:hypothetical protein